MVMTLPGYTAIFVKSIIALKFQQRDIMGTGSFKTNDLRSSILLKVNYSGEERQNICLGW